MDIALIFIDIIDIKSCMAHAQNTWVKNNYITDKLTANSLISYFENWTQKYTIYTNL